MNLLNFDCSNLFFSKEFSTMILVGARGLRKGTTSCGCHYKGIVSPKRESTQG